MLSILGLFHAAHKRYTLPVNVTCVEICPGGNPEHGANPGRNLDGNHNLDGNRDAQAVNTLVLGKTRAKQFYADDSERTGSASVLLHGDGAFSGQGIVFETLDLCNLVDYTVGGTIHLVVNNQV